MKAEIVREEMNRCGRAGIPFLFGVDFEGIHGFFVEKPLSDPSVYFTIGTIGHYKTPLSPIPEPRIKILHSSFETYQEKFRIVHQGLSRGDIHTFSHLLYLLQLYAAGYFNVRFHTESFL